MQRNLGRTGISQSLFSSWRRNLARGRKHRNLLLILSKVRGGQKRETKAIKHVLVLPGQKGTPHPQSDHPKARMFKVLKDVLEEKAMGSRGTTSLKVGGRVRCAEAKKLLAKELNKSWKRRQPL
ncbi:unnamed protein product [Durusdinium trenchii]|uniref:Uncharacterized protein n=1 Tax=Durusdinium trenchii TaxID=1381693 RepID=A0ABP0MLR6_9DINO